MTSDFVYVQNPTFILLLYIFLFLLTTGKVIENDLGVHT